MACPGLDTWATGFKAHPPGRAELFGWVSKEGGFHSCWPLSSFMWEAGKCLVISSEAACPAQRGLSKGSQGGKPPGAALAGPHTAGSLNPQITLVWAKHYYPVSLMRAREDTPTGLTAPSNLVGSLLPCNAVSAPHCPNLALPGPARIA